MRVKMWSRPLLWVGLLSLGLYAEPAAAAEEEGGTQVSVKLPAGSGELPEGEKLVEALLAAGGKHVVKATRQKSPEQDHVTLQLWGPTVPAADIPKTLRDAFPVLARADIQVSALAASERPKVEEALRRGGDGTRKVRKIIKKHVEEKDVEKEQQQ
jgi:hypothetical protein